jgi:hypothetical protein
MKSTLAFLFLAVCAMSLNAQEPVAKPVTPVQPEIVIRDSAPCQQCMDHNHTNHEGPFHRWLITDWEQSTRNYRNPTHVTLWFIPRPRALVIAICP